MADAEPDAPARWPFYCEENVWRLCGAPPFDADPTTRVLVISNRTRTVAMTGQRAAEPGDPVVWDYHVVVAVGGPGQWRVWDVDCRAGVDLGLGEYLTTSFGTAGALAAGFEPWFRVVAAGRYRAELCSDRSHMRDASGRFVQPPPPWPPIGVGSNLMRIVDFGDETWGPFVALPDLEAALSREP